MRKETEQESYERRRDHLLEMMKRQRWDEDEPKVGAKRGKKPKEKPKPKLDMSKPQNQKLVEAVKQENKFFKLD